MKKKSIVLLIIIVAIYLFYLNNRRLSNTMSAIEGRESQVSEKQYTLEHKILKQWNFEDNGLGLIVLVSEKASKQEVLKLAEYLKNAHRDKELIIDIYDSEEAYLNRDNHAFSEEEYSKHLLVQIAHWDDEKIKWSAVERDH